MKKTLPSVTLDNFVECKPDFVPATYDQDGVQATSAIASDGLEYPDPVPFSPTVNTTLMADEGMRAVIERISREEAFLRSLEDLQVETEEEANDFDIDDDPLDPLTPFEKVFEPPTTPEVKNVVQPVSGSPKGNKGSDQEDGGGSGGVTTTPPASSAGS